MPCLLPPVISQEQWREIVALGKKRHRWGGKGGVSARDDHRIELLSGIAYDARCGHQLHTARHEGDDYYVRCAERGIERHGSLFRARHAGEMLDEIGGSVEFDDNLVGEVEAALRARAGAAAPARAEPPAAVTKLRSALAAMGGDPALAAARRSLDEQILALESAEQRRQQQLVNPPKRPDAILAKAISSLGSWRKTWATSSIADKNRVLRAAGVRAFIEPIAQAHISHRKDVPPYSRLVRIEVESPEFALALALGTGLPVDGLSPAPHGSMPSTSTGGVRIVLPAEYAQLVAAYREELEEAA